MATVLNGEIKLEKSAFDKAYAELTSAHQCLLEQHDTCQKAIAALTSQWKGRAAGAAAKRAKCLDTGFREVANGLDALKTNLKSAREAFEAADASIADHIALVETTSP